MFRPPPNSTLFPYTTLFRSLLGEQAPQHEGLLRRIEPQPLPLAMQDRKSTRLNSSHVRISYAVFCLKKKKNRQNEPPHQEMRTELGLNTTAGRHKTSSLADH